MHKTRAISVDWQEWRWVLLAAVVIVALAVSPYLAVWLLGPSDKVYTGMLFNSFDGHSYLAKMRQGANGEWLFRLPFTSETQRGAFFYGYYLLLGHVANWLGLPLIVAYAVARSLNGFALLLVCYRFVAEFLVEARNRRMAFLIISLSSGLSWITAAFGLIGTDLVFLETNTFLSIVINPHFPLAQMLMLLIFLAVASPLESVQRDTVQPMAASKQGGSPLRGGSELLRVFLGSGAALALAIVFPMMLIVVFVVLGVFLTWRSLSRHQGVSPSSHHLADWSRAVIAGLCAAPLMVYYVAAIHGDPLLSEWYYQDVAIIITPTWQQTLIGYGLLVPLAVAGALWCMRRGRGMFLLIWAALALGLVYTPLALQCRLLTGLHIGVGLLAAMGLIRVVQPNVGRWQALVLPVALLVFALPTVALMVFHASVVTRLGWPFFMTAGECAALAWLRDAVPADDLVLASPQMGLMIPSWAGQRVIYGHPLETISAPTRKAELEAFFAGERDLAALLQEHDIQYIFIGPKEKSLGEFDPTAWQKNRSFGMAYSNHEVTIYRLSEQAQVAPDPSAPGDYPIR